VRFTDTIVDGAEKPLRGTPIRSDQGAMMKRTHQWTLFVVFLVFAGCGDRGERLVKVTGTATHNGIPIPHVAIHFAPENGRRSFALTSAEGKFNMLYTDGREGVLVGAHKVWIELPMAGAKKDPEQKKRLATQQNDPVILQILQKYGNAEITPIQFEIKEPREIDLKLD
jgi:hypothetical protein